MFHKAVELEFKEGTELELTFTDGCVKRYDVAALFGKYPQLRALEDRNLFLSGKLTGAYGIIWNDELDLEAETVYQDGIFVRTVRASDQILSVAFSSARARAAITQKELAQLSGIDQSDISKIERGAANPSLMTLNRLAEAMGMRLELKFVPK